MKYEKTQFGLAIPVAVLLGAAASGAALLSLPEEAGNARQAMAFAIVVLIVLAILFHKLTVVVDSDKVHVRFGIGWPFRRIPLVDIRSCSAVRNAWWYGWGIRLTPHGWLYSVWGLDAVELVLDDNRKFRIGTADPSGLERAIRERLKT